MIFSFLFTYCGEEGENDVLPQKLICIFCVEKENKNQDQDDFSWLLKYGNCLLIPTSLAQSQSFLPQ